MHRYCSMHCGRFQGVDEAKFKESRSMLAKKFLTVRYDVEADTLDICGAQDLNHDPDELCALFNRLAELLKDKGKGRILLNCGDLEMCFFRKNMWKLVHVGMPEDPFEGLQVVG